MVITFPTTNASATRRAPDTNRLLERLRRRVGRPHPAASGLDKEEVAGTRRIRVLSPAHLLASASFGSELVERIVGVPVRLRSADPGTFVEPREQNELVIHLVEGPGRRRPGVMETELSVSDGTGLLRAALPLWRFAATMQSLRFGPTDPISLSHLPDFLEAATEVPIELIRDAAEAMERGFYALTDGPHHFAVEAAGRLSHSGLPAVPLSGAPHHPLAHGRSAVLMFIDPTRPVGHLPLLRQLRARGVRLVLIFDERQREVGLLADVAIPMRLGPAPHALLAADLLVERIASELLHEPNAGA